MSELETIQKDLRKFRVTRDQKKAIQRAPGEVKGLLKHGKALYGPDSRIESQADKRHANLASSVCILVDSDRLKKVEGGYELSTDKFGESYKLCEGELFSEQPVLGFGSGFLVDSNVIATAGHCLNAMNKDNVAILFDFELVNGKVRTERRKEEVFFIDKLHAVTEESDGADFGFATLDRTPSNLKSLAISESDPGKNDEVFCIGHPVGLPKKIAQDAKVFDDSIASYFVANLDTFGGNSGSPVFNKANEVCGILVRGETDFVQLGDCVVAATFPLNKAGEEVCRASVWKDKLVGNKLQGIADINGNLDAQKNWGHDFMRWRTSVSRSPDHFARFMLELELAQVWTNKTEEQKFDSSVLAEGVNRAEKFDQAFKWITAATSRKTAEEMFSRAAKRVFG